MGPLKQNLTVQLKRKHFWLAAMVISHSDEQAKLLLLLANVKSENDTTPQRVVSVTSLPQITRLRDLVAARESRRTDTLLFAHLSVISLHFGEGRNSTWQRCLSCSFVRSGCLDSFSTGPPWCCQPWLSGDLWCNCMAPITKEKKKLLKTEDVLLEFLLLFFSTLTTRQCNRRTTLDYIYI